MSDSVGEAGTGRWRQVAARVVARIGGIPAARTLGAVLAVFDRAGGGLVTGGLAYAALFALLPGLLLAIAVVGLLVSDPATRDQLTYDISIALPPLDGIVMANSLHFQRDPHAVLRVVLDHLVDGGRLVLVEYDADHGNQWVPFPLAYRTWMTVAARAGLRDTRRIGAVPSRFLGSIYAAVSLR